MSLSVQPSHTTQEYSMMGSKYERYIWFRATRLNVYLSFLIIPITSEALLRIFSIWLCHCPLLLNVKPKCLCSVTNLIRVPSKIKFGSDSISLRVKSIASVLRGLKLINHLCIKDERMKLIFFLIMDLAVFK